MIIAMIAAMAKHRGIGHNNTLPWHMPADMHHFKTTTMGKPIIMGRKTFESFGAKALPGRNNIILTRNRNYKANDASVCSHPQAAIECAGQASEVIVIGGASVYELFLNRAQRLYLTFINAELTTDSRFPDYEQFTWRQLSRQDFHRDARNPFDYRFEVLQREPA